MYILNEEAKGFMLILTDQLDDKANELINPIDTLPVNKNFPEIIFQDPKILFQFVTAGKQTGFFSLFILKKTMENVMVS